MLEFSKMTQPGGLPRTNLKLEWLMSGNPNDTSGNGNNGTVSGATLAADRKGSANSAYSFINTSTIIAGSPYCIDMSRPFTINYWVKLTDFSYHAVPCILTVGDSNSFSTKPIAMGLSNNISFSGFWVRCGKFQIGDAALETRTNVTPYLGSWVMLTVSYNGGGYSIGTPQNWKMYINGVSQTIYGSGGFLGSPANSTRVNGYSALPFKGSFDDLRIYDGTQLTQAEITALYNE